MPYQEKHVLRQGSYMKMNMYVIHSVWAPPIVSHWNPLINHLSTHSCGPSPSDSDILDALHRSSGVHGGEVVVKMQWLNLRF